MLKMTIGHKKVGYFYWYEGKNRQSEHKHDLRYENGEIQLVSVLIVACWQNYATLSGDIISKVM